MQLLQLGDVVLVDRGASIPADGVVAHGCSSVNESLITGEAVPVLKNVGSNVIGVCGERLLFSFLERSSDSFVVFTSTQEERST